MSQLLNLCIGVEDGNGCISVDELGVVLKALGRTPLLGWSPHGGIGGNIM
jgi:hypothetical protein